MMNCRVAVKRGGKIFFTQQRHRKSRIIQKIKIDQIGARLCLLKTDAKPAVDIERITVQFPVFVNRFDLSF
jgi:hypothetical protein